jgi:hypothetical protein
MTGLLKLLIIRRFLTSFEMTNNIDYSGFLAGEAAQKSTSLFREHVIPSGTIVERGISSACHLRILPNFLGEDS